MREPRADRQRPRMTGSLMDRALYLEQKGFRVVKKGGSNSIAIPNRVQRHGSKFKYEGQRDCVA